MDLNDFEMRGMTTARSLFTVSGAKLTLKGGSLSAKKLIGSAINGGEIIIESGSYEGQTDYAFAATGTGSKVTMNGGRIHALDGGIGAFEGAEIVMNGGEIDITDNFALFTNGSAGKGGNTITVNGGRMTGNITSAGYEACGVYVANNDTFVMNGGEITANGGVGILMRGGNVTVNNGTVKSVATEAHPAGSQGHVGDSVTNVGLSGIIYQENANYPGKAGMNLHITGGTVIGVDHAVEVLSNEEQPQVFVTGGSFTPPYPEA